MLRLTISMLSILGRQLTLNVVLSNIIFLCSQLRTRFTTLCSHPEKIYLLFPPSESESARATNQVQISSVCKRTYFPSVSLRSLKDYKELSLESSCCLKSQLLFPLQKEKKVLSMKSNCIPYLTFSSVDSLASSNKFAAKQYFFTLFSLNFSLYSIIIIIKMRNLFFFFILQVANWGAFLLKADIKTMSFAPRSTREQG